MKHEKSCGAVVFTGGDVRQYVLVRSAKGEYWGLPKGHVEDGETEQETALREVLEETGVQARLLDGFREVIEYNIFDKIRKQVVLFVAEYDNQKPDCSLYEISGIAVLPIDEAVKLMTYDDMRQVLIKADRWLNKQATSHSYHLSYEARYQKVYAAGADYWGHTPDDDELTLALTDWVNRHNLKGKRIIEFFCGEGAAGVILSGLGCIYHGVDISPTALQKAACSLANYPTATVSELNVVSGKVDGLYDAALDVMGFHMLVTDPDRAAYLRNVFSCLKQGSPMLFFREMSGEGSIDSFVETYDEWLEVSGHDYTVPKLLNFRKDGKQFQIETPCVPGRSKTKAGYIGEIENAGFTVDSVVDMPPSNKCPESVSIYVSKKGAPINV